MKTISMSELKRMSALDVKLIIPLVITVDGAETFLISSVEDTISLKGLHPRMVSKIKAFEKRGRAYVPAPKTES